YPAVAALAAVPAQAVPLLRKQLQPVSLADADLMKKLLADLDSKRFAVRDRANSALAKLGESAVPALRDALARGPSPEVSVRLKALLEQAANAEPTGAMLRGLRAIAVLEQIGNAEAKQVLQYLAAGASEARLTCEAKAALQRLFHRS